MDTWARVLWPWIDLADRRCPRPAGILAANLAPLVDARDLTVDIAVLPCQATAFTHCRALAALIEAGLLVPLDNGRHRIERPAWDSPLVRP